jgi:hypothetical protein
VNPSFLPRWLLKLLGIQSPSAFYMEFGRQLTENFQRGLEEGSDDISFQKAMALAHYKQWQHYVAEQRAPERKFKKARIRNGLM